uniref:Integrase, catalytic region, zinc finger, CCHC-type, peptidase aspartic, catalytic n=1 Tax=Tanacetum cinerariifolium TaxID=118510 RepID=A0A699GV03_TANCI|nr:hypothetical protein [Tanacetum cinerariifolium]
MTYGIGPGKYTVLAVCQVIHYASGFLFLIAVCLLRQRVSVVVWLLVFLKILSHSDLGNKPLPISFLGSGLVFSLHNGLPLSSSSGLTVSLRNGLPCVAVCYRETIHDYYVQFTKLINDMRNIKMIMSRMQLNSKFVNNMLPEWGRFIKAVKLNKGLRDSNYDQLYAYLKQHEAHANENKMMLDRFTQHTVDPLALVSNVSHQQYYSQSSTTLPSTHVQPHFADPTHHDSGLSPTDKLIKNLTNTLALLTQSYLKPINSELHQTQRTKPLFKTAWLLFRMFRVDKTKVKGTMQGEQVQLNLEYFKDKMLPMQAQENGVVLNEEQLLFIACGQDNIVDEDVDEPPIQDLTLNVDNVFQADECNAFDSDVDEAPTKHTMFMVNLSSVDPVCDEASPSYDSDILSEDNANPVVQNNVSSVQHDASMMIINEMHEQTTQRASVKAHPKVDGSLKEENLKKELHSVKMQLNFTINHNKSMAEEVTSLKNNFQHKENKYLEEFLDMKALKEKAEDKLFKQDQSLQTVHMLCKPKSYYDEQRKVAVGYKNPLYLIRAKKVKPALYNGHEIIKSHHVLAIVQNSEDTLEIAKITKKKMNDKMKPLCDRTKH